MEYQHDVTDEQSPSRDFVEGFNHCELLADLAPDLLEEISPVNNPQNDYFDGFFAARIHIREEQAQQKEIEELQSLREKSQERDNERSI